MLTVEEGVNESMDKGKKCGLSETVKLGFEQLCLMFAMQGVCQISEQCRQ